MTRYDLRQLEEHRETVRENIEMLAPVMGSLYAKFYTHLFRIDPAQAAIFDGSAVALNRKFINMMATFKGIRQLDKMHAAIEGLTRRHTTYGLRPEFLEPFGEALIAALSEQLGDKFTEGLRTAWTSIYDQIVSIMKESLKQHPGWLANHPQKADTHFDTGLFEAIGGEEVVRNVHTRFYSEIFEDDWLGQFFYGKSKEALIHKQTQFMVACFGGPNHYRGEPPALAHMHMLITEEMAIEREKILRKAIFDEGLREEIAERWLAIDRSFWPSINKQGIGECVTTCFGQAPATVKKPANYRPR